MRTELAWPAGLQGQHSCHLPGARGLSCRYGQELCQGRLAWDPLWLPAWTSTAPQPRWTVTSELTLAHCSSSTGSPRAPCPPSLPTSNPSRASPGLCTLSKSRGSVVPPQWVPQQSGCLASTFPNWGTSLQAGTETACCAKAILLTKIFNFLSSESFLKKSELVKRSPKYKTDRRGPTPVKPGRGARLPLGSLALSPGSPTSICREHTRLETLRP